tara:strand:+ start:4976 stop:5383 length:408 start_codon:yes stop_codon:yes gene_type:complete
VTEYVLIAEGSYGKVLATTNAMNDIVDVCKGNPSLRKAIQKKCELFAEEGQTAFNHKTLRSEGKRQVGGKLAKKIQVWAISHTGKQYRLYGGIDTTEGVFVAGSCDKKQQDAADQAMLDRAAEAFHEYMEDKKGK